MIKLNSKGFGVVEGLLIFVIVGLIGGAGYYVYKAQQNTNETLNNTGNSDYVASEAEEKQAVDPTADWETYTNEQPKFSFKYPSDWTLSESEAGISLKTADYKEATTDSDVELCTKIASGYEITVSYDSELASKNLVAETLASKSPLIEGAKPTKLGGYDAVRYRVSPGECGFSETTSTYLNGHGFYIKSTLYKELGEYEDEYNLIAKSFAFN